MLLAVSVCLVGVSETYAAAKPKAKVVSKSAAKSITKSVKKKVRGSPKAAPQKPDDMFRYFENQKAQLNAMREKNGQPTEQRYASTPRQTGVYIPNERTDWSYDKCTGQGAVTLAAAPATPADLAFILPMGSMYDAHVTPVDHQYWHPVGEGGPANPERVEIHAPADGNIVFVEHETQTLLEQRPGGLPPQDDYRVVIEHSCTFYTYLIHVNKLTPAILAQVQWQYGGRVGSTFSWVRIPIKAGEVIGKTGDHPFDFAVVNTEANLPGFLSPRVYDKEFWKVHTVDPFDYFTPSLRTELVAKNLRTSPPLGGKIDYDAKGKLVGNWFKTGTNGYAGAGGWRYWAGHLALAYDPIDPTHVTISIGTFKDYAEQFGVKGNAPDPATIGAANGIAAYELVPFDYYVGNPKWDKNSFASGVSARNNDSAVAGVLLAQVVDDHHLKVEIQPGKTLAQTPVFTEAAVVYER